MYSVCSVDACNTRYFTKKRKQSQKRKETKRNEGRVNKKRRVEDVEDVEVDKKRSVEDVEKLEDVFASFNIEDDDVPDRQYIETFLNQFAKRLCIDDDV